MYSVSVNGNWGEWGEWEDCTEICNKQGLKRRSRSCNQPKPKYGGSECDGIDSDTSPCYNHCPSKNYIFHRIHRLKSNKISMSLE